MIWWTSYIDLQNRNKTLINESQIYYKLNIHWIYLSLSDYFKFIISDVKLKFDINRSSLIFNYNHFKNHQQQNLKWRKCSWPQKSCNPNLNPRETFIDYSPSTVRPEINYKLYSGMVFTNIWKMTNEFLAPTPISRKEG